MQKPNGRTIFLLNIPPYIYEEELKFAFEKFGQIKSIFLTEKPSGNSNDDENKTSYSSNIDKLFLQQDSSFMNRFKVAYIVFNTTNSVQKVLQANELHFYKEDGTGIIKSGLEKWTQNYIDSIIDENTLQNEIDKYMALSDERDMLENEIQKSKESDENGWITVAKRKRTVEEKESKVTKTKKKKKTELKNFYTFQIKDSKMKNIINLRKKFEEDKEKLEALKKSRKFKPF